MDSHQHIHQVSYPVVRHKHLRPYTTKRIQIKIQIINCFILHTFFRQLTPQMRFVKSMSMMKTSRIKLAILIYYFVFCLLTVTFFWRFIGNDSRLLFLHRICFKICQKYQLLVSLMSIFNWYRRHIIKKRKLKYKGINIFQTNFSWLELLWRTSSFYTSFNLQRVNSVRKVDNRIWFQTKEFRMLLHDSKNFKKSLKSWIFPAIPANHWTYFYYYFCSHCMIARENSRTNDGLTNTL